MLPLIIIVLISTVLIIVLYQLVIQKYYWGLKASRKRGSKIKRGGKLWRLTAP